MMRWRPDSQASGGWKLPCLRVRLMRKPQIQMQGYPPFGGGQGSGSTGKAIASFDTLPLYMREQSRTVVVR